MRIHRASLKRHDNSTYQAVRYLIYDVLVAIRPKNFMYLSAQQCTDDLTQPGL